MRKCYFHKDGELGDVLIPWCWDVVHSNDINDCTCSDAFPQTFVEFEKKRFNYELKERNHYIEELESEISRLNEIINTLNNPK